MYSQQLADRMTARTCTEDCRVVNACHGFQPCEKCREPICSAEMREGLCPTCREEQEMEQEGDGE